jgi:hypothetical protein
MHSAPLLALGALLVSATYAHITPVNGTQKHPVPQVYTACTKPNTVAITQVSIFLDTSQSDIVALLASTMAPTYIRKPSSTPLIKLEAKCKWFLTPVLGGLRLTHLTSTSTFFFNGNNCSSFLCCPPSGYFSHASCSSRPLHL